MALVHHGKHLGDDGFLGGQRSDLKVGLAILVGIVAIAATLAALAVANERFDIGPRMEPVAYILVAIAAVVLLVTFLAPLIQNQALASLSIFVSWVFALSGAFMVFRYFG
ncbi:MAG: hypothetical protein QGI63_11565 [Rhodospirillales bacterium]|jgi:hypothetical protein|nr:hypothetical protein [Rhodospirillales bacterium]MDP6774898.1 hypothetical protein [Rhodospirillales bacterium]|tara:strand:- start:303 stop:632 length:330 start_codon:yes stop_codon:yes gene_type:complete